uniref:Uncharacterized protein n=1 Tax=Anguilla anguilla TaxID=7936 RepID=A0A0E9QB42_ANGAN
MRVRLSQTDSGNSIVHSRQSRKERNLMLSFFKRFRLVFR